MLAPKLRFDRSSSQVCLYFIAAHRLKGADVEFMRRLEPHVNLVPIIAKAEKLAGSRLNNELEIVIQATRYRSQEKNRADARQRLIAILADAAKPPPPKRKPTRPSMNARRKRVESKVKRGQTKKLRGRVNLD